jgi:D-glycero-D-manno-heptose 1,7-bisphosphate phosphatase
MATSRRALFLDRDGVINEDYGYVHRVEDFVYVDGIFELARAAYQAGFVLVVVTNQAGIGRGYYTETQFHELTAWMCVCFEREGAPIEKVYWCPYHPVYGLGEYLRDSPDRKPRPGMFLRAESELLLTMSSSVLVGDKPSDLAAGAAAGVGCLVLLGDGSSCVPRPTFSVRSLYEVLPLLSL